MTNEEAKKEAKKLFDKFYESDEIWGCIPYPMAKECALIALKIAYEAREKAYNEMSEFCIDVACQAVIFSKKEYEQIKSEIENL